MPDRETPVLVFDCPPQGFQLPQCFLCTQWTQHFHSCSYRSHINNKLAKTFRCSVLDYSSRSPVRSPLCCYEPSTLLLDFRSLSQDSASPFPFFPGFFLSFFLSNIEFGKFDCFNEWGFQRDERMSCFLDVCFSLSTWTPMENEIWMGVVAVEHLFKNT